MSATLAGAHVRVVRGQPVPRRVGILLPNADAARADLLAAFEDRLRALGHLPGSTLLLEMRNAAGDAPRLEAFARELAGIDPAAIVAIGANAAQAARNATRTVPILFVAVGDPVARGFVADPRRPEGNMTGSSDLLPEAPRLRLALLAEVLPGFRRVAVISNAAVTARAPLDAAAAVLGVSLLHVDVRQAGDFSKAYAALAADLPDALIVTPNPVTFGERHATASFCRVRRLPCLFGWREFMDAGGLLSLGANMQRLYELAATQLDQVLAGIPLARIPIGVPDYDLVVDLRTARAIGVRIPPAVMARATTVID